MITAVMPTTRRKPIIRVATPADLGAVVELYAAHEREHAGREVSDAERTAFGHLTFEALFDVEHRVHVATLGKRVVAFTWASLEERPRRVLHLRYLYVRPEARGSRIGPDFALAAAQGAKALAVPLTVVVPYGKRAVRKARRRGFRALGVVMERA